MTLGKEKKSKITEHYKMKLWKAMKDYKKALENPYKFGKL